MRTTGDYCNFEWRGTNYRMKADAVEAAYRYYQSQLLLEDVTEQLSYFLYGPEGVPDDPEEKKKCLEQFEKTYGISFPGALHLADPIISEFLRIRRADIAENDSWAEAVRKVLCDPKVKAVLLNCKTLSPMSASVNCQ